jgi:hypothetical protein
MPALIMLVLQDGFFGSELDFWRDRPPPLSPPSSTDLFREGDSAPPAELARLLDDPSPENARRYLAFQAERLARIRRAVEAIRQELGREQDQIEFHSLPGCPACERQERELSAPDLAPLVRRSFEPAESYPRLWLRVRGRSRMLVGLHSADFIRRALSEMKGDRHD